MYSHFLISIYLYLKGLLQNLKNGYLQMEKKPLHSYFSLVSL